mgnify:CR=1 FL=1
MAKKKKRNLSDKQIRFLFAVGVLKRAKSGKVSLDKDKSKALSSGVKKFKESVQKIGTEKARKQIANTIKAARKDLRFEKMRERDAARRFARSANQSGSRAASGKRNAGATLGERRERVKEAEEKLKRIRNELVILKPVLKKRKRS